MYADRVHAQVLTRRLQSVRDPSVRATYVRNAVSALRPDAVVALVAALDAQRSPEHLDVLLLVSVALAEPSLAELRERSAVEAHQLGLADVAELLASHEADTPEIGELRVPDFGVGRSLTLGERKSLARKRERGVLQRVLRDPSPDVIRILLGNPSLTEPDVVQLAALRPIDPASLREIFRHPKWTIRYPVRRALVQNPYLELALALALAPHLNVADARRLAASPDLRIPLRRALGRVGGLRLH